MKLKPAHQQALRATLRVTLFAALGACGGGGKSSATNTTTTNPTNTGTASAPAHPTSDAECRTALKEAFPNGDPNWPNPQNPTPREKTAVSDADLQACCDGIAQAGSTEDYRSLGCCSVKDNGVHCTPWGPPTPPAMRAVA